MKNFIILFVTMLSLNAFAQPEYQTTVDGQVTGVWDEDHAILYQKNGEEVYFYDENMDIMKTVVIDPPEGYSSYHINDPSTHNYENGILYFIVQFYVDSIFITHVYDENGTKHIDVNGNSGQVIGTKLLIYNNGETLVYNLQGTPNKIKESLKHNVEIYPNPVTDQLNINASQTGIIEIYDMSAKLIDQYKSKPGVNTINVNDYTEGNYILKIGKRSIRFIKE